MAKSMVFMTRGSLDPEQMYRVMSELNAGSDRSLAIVGGSVAERALEDALVAHLHGNTKLTGELFRPTGALGPFATKIKLGFLVGIYGEDALRELNIIKDIRNDFAHKLNIHSFDDGSISDRTRLLRFGERYAFDTQEPRPALSYDPKTTHIGGWHGWFSVAGKTESLKIPRERFLISLQAMCYGLSVPHHCAMPQPHF